MSTLLSELIKATLLGIPSGIFYDIFKKVWQKTSRKSWEKLYLEAFVSSVQILRNELAKYGDGTINILVDQFESALASDISIKINNASFSTISRTIIEGQIAKAIADKNLLMIGGHTLSEDDYRQLVYRTVDFAQSLFRKEILNNQYMFKEEVLREFKDNRLILEQIQSYLSLHHNISLDLTEEIRNGLENQGLTLNQIADNIKEIKKRLGLDKSRSELIEQIKLSQNIKPQKGSILTDGVCRGYMLIPKPEHYFLAQEFSTNNDDLKSSLLQALQEFGVNPMRADDLFESGLLLCKISELIQSTLFGIYQLSKSQNRNVYLELGISIGLGKQFILIKDGTASIASSLSGLEYYPITSYLALRYDFGEKLKPFIANLIHYKPKVSNNIEQQATVLISHGCMNAADFSLDAAKAINGAGLSSILLEDLEDNNIEQHFNKEGIPYPKILGKSNSLKLNEIVEAVNASQLGIFRVDKKCSPNSFLALGIALGLNRPVILVHKTKSAIPSDLQGISVLPFTSFLDLNKKITAAIKLIADH